MDNLLPGFETYLEQEKKVSANTKTSYLRDVKAYLDSTGNDRRSDLRRQTPENFRHYFQSLAADGRSPATIQRAKASLVAFYAYLISVGSVQHNPVKAVSLARPAHTLPQVLTPDEVERLLSAEGHSSPDKELRDRAMLELLYATGMKASELISLDLQDANPTLGYVRCRNSRGERILPLYPEACRRLEHYIRKIRPYHVADPGEQALFLNASGTRMTRQGFWKIIKTRAAAARIEKDITPQILRHSFAMHLLKNGADITMIQEILGHADISTTQIYTKQFKSDLKDRYDQFHPKAKVK